VSIISGITPSGAGGTVTTVNFAPVAATDADLIAAGVHLPLELNAQVYYDDNSGEFASKLDFGASRAAYTPATQLEPEWVAWSADESKLYVNLQENSAIITIDVATATAEKIDALDLKDWSSAGGTAGIDTIKDHACTLAFKPGFKAMRMPDSIAVYSAGGQDYIITANEGDDKEYGDFEEKQKFKDVITSCSSTPDFKSEFTEFSFFDAQVGTDACASFDGTKMRITIGSSAVDYSTPTAPVYKATVGFGGRGLSIWKASDMSLVWDSGSILETEQCAKYPWAHNTVADEEFSMVRDADGNVGARFNLEGPGKVSTVPPYLVTGGDCDTCNKLQEDIWKLNAFSPTKEDGCDVNDAAVTRGPGCDENYCACPLGKTVDERSLKDGAGPEAVVVGEACGKTIMVTATEKQGTAFVFDVSDPPNTQLLFVQHLSPASQTKNPSVAYADRTLGEVDPESITFLTAEKSPTGNAGILFSGSWSGTLSLYEFEGCQTVTGGGDDDDDDDDDEDDDDEEDDEDDDDDYMKKTRLLL